ncbi:MAG: transglycosylase SLT domain-containing protein [Thermodesulfobacteriota bacterium]
MPERLTPWRPLIQSASERHGLDPGLTAAVVLAESAAQPAAVRFEAHYRWLFKPESVKPDICSIETEVMLQKISFGLMQIMGAVARERGFQGWLTELCRPEQGLEYGCRHLAWLLDRFSPIEAAVSAYNQGFPRRGPDGRYLNQPYVDKVMNLYHRIKTR